MSNVQAKYEAIMQSDIMAIIGSVFIISCAIISIVLLSIFILTYGSWLLGFGFGIEWLKPLSPVLYTASGYVSPYTMSEMNSFIPVWDFLTGALRTV